MDNLNNTSKNQKIVKITVPQIPDEIFLALFGEKKGTVTHIERGINPGFTVFQNQKSTTS